MNELDFDPNCLFYKYNKETAIYELNEEYPWYILDGAPKKPKSAYASFVRDYIIKYHPEYMPSFESLSEEERIIKLQKSAKILKKIADKWNIMEKNNSSIIDNYIRQEEKENKEYQQDFMEFMRIHTIPINIINEKLLNPNPTTHSNSRCS